MIKDIKTSCDVKFKKNRRFTVHLQANWPSFVEANGIENYLTIGSIYLTCAVKAITVVSQITAADEAVRYVGTGSKLTASSVVLSAFINICASCHKIR